MVNGVPPNDSEAAADVLQRVRRNLRFLSGAHGLVPLASSRQFQLCVPLGSEAVRLRLETGEEIKIQPKTAILLAPRCEAVLEWKGAMTLVIVGLTSKAIAEAAGQVPFPGVALRGGSFTDPLILNIASMVRDAFVSQLDFAPLLVASATSLLAIRLLTLASEMPSDAKREQLSPSALKRVLEFVDNKLTEDFDLDEMAHAAGCSRFHFARAFRSCTGVSPWRYVTRCRLRHAQMLLRTHENLSVADVCHMVGFQDQSHFTRAFKSEFSVTPGNFRRETFELAA